MVAHKLVWEVLRRRDGNAGRPPFTPIKAVKIAVLSGLLLQCFLPEILPMASEPRVLRVAGALLLTLGLAVAVAARVQLGRNWSNVESATVLPGQQLVSAGQYRHIRHPIYIGDILLVAGYEMALNSWLWLMVIPLTVFVWRKAAQEEALLESGLDGYAGYLKTSGRFFPRNAAVGVAAAAIAFSIQFANVQVNFNGNWSGVFCAGRAFPAPAYLHHEKLFVFPHSGYDGQFYHYIAHDPWPSERTARSIDVPRLRYTRILVPALSYVVALGQQDWIDPSFHAISLLAFGLGAWWLACYASLTGANRYWGLAFLLIPAVLISLDRSTVDVMFLAFCCGFSYYAARASSAGIYAVIVLATLNRDTGFLLWGAYGLHLLINRRWTRAGIFGTAALPAVAWHLIVRANTQADFPSLGLATSAHAIWDHLLKPAHYEFPSQIANLAVALDYVSLAGVALAIVLVLVRVFREYDNPSVLAAAAFVALPFTVGGHLAWHDPFAYPRTLSPMLLFLGLAAMKSRSWLGYVPLLLVLPRILMELAGRLPFLRGLLH
ncbi:MAG TPA: methyltransferase [Paludibaculum sp.]|jgi:protein-S-isoprenylcysteine O-methyltransferase Ste14